MTREQEIDVLVVGAGPTGMLAALALAKGGVRVRIIDKEERTAAHSYACALHPQSLALLDRHGLADEILASGRRIETIAFYEGETRQAEMRLSALPVKYPFLVVLPQSALEERLERQLLKTSGVRVEWNHRLSALEPAKGGVVAVVDELCETSKGYIVREWDWEVKKTLRARAAFVIGADGFDSGVRQLLDIECERVAEPATFEVYEFESDGRCGNEARVVIDGGSTNVFWPLTGNRCRWSLQEANIDDYSESHSKERTDVLLVDEAVDVKTRTRVLARIQACAPWFAGCIKALDWSVDVQFEPRLATRFGRDRCWLAGDAGHQALPVGMQSVNVGLSEAEDLAARIVKILREHGSLDLLEAYGRERRNEWQQLLGAKGGLKPRGTACAWIKEHASRILPCIPGSGAELKLLADQLHLEFR